MALAHLLTRYGRKIAPKASFRLLHVNHQWRGQESLEDAEFVKACAKRWKVPVTVRTLPPPDLLAETPKDRSRSPEDLAREHRKRIFQKEASKHKALVFTAHHADDFAETVLWRLLSGNAKTQGGGILFAHGVERRLLLRTRKSDLKQYLIEEGESWREDLTNYDTRFLRARMRAELMPQLEQLFPRAVQHLVALGLDAQRGAPSLGAPLDPSETLLKLPVGIKLRRAHWEAIEETVSDRKTGELSLPGGWKLRRETQSAR
jgi:tRNA(Ile)-lysidine synthase